MGTSIPITGFFAWAISLTLVAALISSVSVEAGVLPSPPAAQGALDGHIPDATGSTEANGTSKDTQRQWAPLGLSGSFVHGFIATLSVIIVSELGDKTFFIAAIMAMRHPRLVVLGAAICALSIMHVMSALFGVFALKLVPRTLTYYLSSLLFAIFGINMLREGWKMTEHEAQDEMNEVQEALKAKEETPGGKSYLDVESSTSWSMTSAASKLNAMFLVMFSPVFMQAFSMTFMAEWGDRSQLATIVLAARENTSAVIVAGILGHAFCTGLAVVGGRLVAQKISVRAVTLLGGLVFIFFALTAFVIGPGEEETSAASDLSLRPWQKQDLDDSLVT